MSWSHGRGATRTSRPSVGGSSTAIRQSVTYLVFDLLGLDGTDLTGRPYEERRSLLEQLDLERPDWKVTDVYDDGAALYRAVCDLGLEGVVAKRTTSLYGASRRGWVKVRTRTIGEPRIKMTKAS